MSLTTWDPFNLGLEMDPFREFRRLEREMNRLLPREITQGFGGFGGFEGRLTTFIPRMDYTETDKEYLVKCELPGLSKNDVKIDLDNDLLTISGEKKEEKKEENERIHRLERTYGKFNRSVRLPKNIDVDNIQANFENGVLCVCVPKKAGAEQRKSIQIAEKSGAGKQIGVGQQQKA
eukprot:GEZU01043041.1.p2 GENE.GEZU01043041.1~~GEZU01043041.1.p2  ORF type:complete len:177 (-),score=88.96 GEZU01043041.1:82-612(-)